MLIVLLIAVLGALGFVVFQGIKKGFDLLKKVIIGVLAVACCAGVVLLIRKKKGCKK